MWSFHLSQRFQAHQNICSYIFLAVTGSMRTLKKNKFGIVDDMFVAISSMQHAPVRGTFVHVVCAHDNSTFTMTFLSAVYTFLCMHKKLRA